MVVRFLTSDPADGSVIARQILLSPLRISGKTFCCKKADAYCCNGGAPTVYNVEEELNPSEQGNAAQRRRNIAVAHQSNKNTSNAASAEQLIPEDEVVKPVPLFRFDTADDRILRKLLRDRFAKCDGDEKSIPCTLTVHLIGDLAGCFPFFSLANNILDDRIAPCVSSQYRPLA